MGDMRPDLTVPIMSLSQFGSAELAGNSYFISNFHPCAPSSVFSLSSSPSLPSPANYSPSRWRPITERSSTQLADHHSFAHHHRRARLPYPASAYSKCLVQWHSISSPFPSSRSHALRMPTSGEHGPSTSMCPWVDSWGRLTRYLQSNRRPIRGPRWCGPERM